MSVIWLFPILLSQTHTGYPKRLVKTMLFLFFRDSFNNLLLAYNIHYKHNYVN